MGQDLYDIALGQLAEMVEESRLRASSKVEATAVDDFEELKMAVRDISVEVLFLIKRLESEFDEASDPESINACLANHFNQISREMARVKELRSDPLVW